ncbi:MAG: hypothetical protein Kow00121_45200 [Elainellaceae cyanobacterium]
MDKNPLSSKLEKIISRSLDKRDSRENANIDSLLELIQRNLDEATQQPANNADVQGNELYKLQQRLGELQKIKTVDDLWNVIGQDFDQGIQQLANNAGIAEEDLCEQLARQGFTEAKRDNSCWLTRHWLDLISILALLILFETGLRALGLLAPLHHILGLPHDVVVSVTDLPAFHVVSKKDIKIRSPTEPGTFSKLEDVIGHYTLQPIQRGSILREEQISAAKLLDTDLTNRQILSLPINLNAMATVAVAGSHVDLLILPKAPSTSTDVLKAPTLKDVIVLAVEQRSDGANLIVAINGDTAFEAAKPLLGISDILILY